MSGLHLLYISILGVCIVASGFFSGSETAIVGIQRERVHQLAARDKRGKKLEALLAEPDRTLSTLLIANNFVNILAASVATALLIDLAGESWGPWIVTLALTAVILVFGEIGPKTLAHRHPERFSLLVAGSISTLSRVLQPISTFFTWLTRRLFRLFRIHLGGGLTPVTEDDIRAMAALSESSGEIEAAEREIIDAVFSLADRPIREVMTPRVDIVSLTAPITMEAVQEAVVSTGHSRFPVIADTHDEMLGILAVKDLLRLPPGVSPAEIARLLRPPTYIPESRSVLAVLQEMRHSRFGFGVVVDEHGGVEGIATAKDVISELVGSLQDEYDPTVPSIIPAGPSRWVVDGRTDVDELEEVVNVELPRGDYSTVAGLFMDLAGRIPDEGDQLEVESLTLTVLLMERRRIARIRVEQ
ncbi:MAG: hemolysin family protein [Acidimicrobiia bacterium]|nr:hemolysin family protein [Acidimicrobiia bacterium]